MSIPHTGTSSGQPPEKEKDKRNQDCEAVSLAILGAAGAEQLGPGRWALAMLDSPL